MSKEITVTFVVSDDTDPDDLYRVIREDMEWDYSYHLPDIKVHICSIKIKGGEEMDMKEFYRFGDAQSDIDFILRINETRPDMIQKLLDEYRKNSEEYNDEGWIEYLRAHGYTVEPITILRTNAFYF